MRRARFRGEVIVEFVCRQAARSASRTPRDLRLGDVPPHRHAGRKSVTFGVGDRPQPLSGGI
ncbi:Uncharacterised protein [Amycolatopsis camponoti]|uniref:Uncharacterized protein n=1 Tax=Amycolatopsis camponoti TaxID=2606593 RepID=A0A6I8LX87_9PSEU|nr:Uncharacterised protein [Amycolatopsis camponoti]